MDKIIFIAFSNDRNEPLPTLKEEDEKVYELLFAKTNADQNNYKVLRESFADRETLINNLIQYEDQIAIFLFSGHAGRDSLLLEDGVGQARGIIDLLGNCKNLQLVILNGCSTAGQVQQLMELPDPPAVIATSAPIEDYAATQFSKTFFKSFTDYDATLLEAFNRGLAAAKVIAPEGIQLNMDRAIGRSSFHQEERIWGIYIPNQRKELAYFKLAELNTHRSFDQRIRPNTVLINELWESLAKFIDQNDLKSSRSRATPMIPKLINQNKERQKRNIILKYLPYPISVHLGKLIAKSRIEAEGQRHDFYDKFGKNRLNQLLKTYKSVIELPAFVLLSQLWDDLQDRSIPPLKDREVDVVMNFVQSDPTERVENHFFPLMTMLKELFRSYERVPFIVELDAVDFSEDTTLFDACLTLELLNKRIIHKTLPNNDAAIADECIIAEKKLTEVLKQFSFMANYSFVSVGNIDVYRNRQIREPNYLHHLVRLVRPFAGEPTAIIEAFDDYFLDNASILIMRNGHINKETQFLNLTPFIVDENAYFDDAEGHKLYYFDQFIPTRNIYSYKHIYKPDDPLLRIKMGSEIDEEFKVTGLIYQFNVFWKLLKNEPLNL